jgi:hypothetical protein
VEESLSPENINERIGGAVSDEQFRSIMDQIPPSMQQQIIDRGADFQTSLASQVIYHPSKKQL